MATLVNKANDEKQNRWLLIGALVLAVVAGVLIFAALANFNSDDDGTATVSTGDAPVLVAIDKIAAGTVLEPDMFRTATFAEANVIEGAITDADAIVGQKAATEIVKGQQLGKNAVVQGVANDDLYKALTFNVPAGYRASAISVSEETVVGGLVVAGDRVDVVVTIEEKRPDTGDQEYVRIRTVLQNVEVLAVAQTAVEGVPVIGEDGSTTAPESDATNPAIDRRPDELDADGRVGTVTLALTPQQVQLVELNDYLGDISLALRPFGESEEVPMEDIVIPVYKN